jgi:RNA polymerase sigma factor (sigma-70 family)
VTSSTARAAVARTVREEGARVVATLARMTRDVQLAEDAVQDASIRALAAWEADGIPDAPRAWLTVAARRRALDLLRREAARGGKEEEAIRVQNLFRAEPPDSDVPDDLLRLIFTCCHPALSTEAQVALALRTLCGLTTAEVAHALLVPEATMLKRLTRAKQKIKQARIPYRVPPADELPDRVRGVVAVVYLLFNEGYVATAADTAIRTNLVEEAIRLAWLLHELMPDEPSVTGVLALMLLHDCRREARLDAHGDPVLLADQDRNRWDHHKIRVGVELLGQGLSRTPERPDTYVVQAAIAACHVLAPSYATTPWSAIVSWYDVLLRVSDTPVVRLNRAVAVAELSGAAAGLAEVDAIWGLEHYAWWHATRSLLLARLQRHAEAEEAREVALELDANLVLHHGLSSAGDAIP